MSEPQLDELADGGAPAGLAAMSPSDPPAAGQQDQYLQQQVNML